MTRAELAELVAEHVWEHNGVQSPIDRKYLGRLENGEVRWPNARYRRALRELLGAPSDEALGFRSTNATRPARDVDRRAVIRAAAATFGTLALTRWDHDTALADELGTAGHADHGVARHLAALVDELRRADDVAPTGSLLPSSAGLLAVARHFTAASSGHDQIAIGRVAAEAAMLHWWLMVDAGHDARAEHDNALALALDWGMSPLVGHLYGWRGGLALGEGDLRRAVRLTRIARQPRWGMSPGGLAWAAAYESRAHVLAGDDDAAQRALDDAQAAYEVVDPTNEPPWLYWLADPVLTLDTLDMRVLREGPAAAGPLEDALARLPAERARDASWYRAHLASARARAGDLEGAVRDAEQAARLGRLSGSSWTLGELDQLAHRPRYGALREVLSDLRGSLSETS